MVTLAGTQNLSEFDLHARAILGLPIPFVKLERCGASAVILASDEGVPSISGLEIALSATQSDVRIFGKPIKRPYRRMGVALVYDSVGSNISDVVNKAKSIAAKITVK
jgi:phosphoribosylglycinamide formyltransferase 2